VGVPVKFGARGVEQIIEINVTPEKKCGAGKISRAVKELVDVISSSRNWSRVRFTPLHDRQRNSTSTINPQLSAFPPELLDKMRIWLLSSVSATILPA